VSRKSELSGDSLDLLLDTICNTFGGILFIAMLVAILTSQLSRSASPAAPTAQASQALRKMRGELFETDARLTKLRQAVRQKEDLERKFGDPESQELLTMLHTLDVDSDSLVTERNQKLSNAAESQASLLDTARELERLAELKAATQERLRLKRIELENESQFRSRTAQTPKQRNTPKIQMLFFLKGGRLSGHARGSESGELIHNEDETRIVAQAAGQQFVEPIDNAGLVVSPDGSSSAKIVERLRDFDKERHFLSIFVFKDSFSSFESLKNDVIRAGFEYQLVPFPDDEKVLLGNPTEPILVQ